jgi:TetR/AcrR family tetracycline transcriptional repressor
MMRSIPKRRSRPVETEAATAAAPRQTLTRDGIVRTALELLDETGLEGLTMRHLAQRLGVQAGALYRHIRDKDQLLDLLADAICAEQQTPDPGLPWREQLRALCAEQLRLLCSRRDAARIMAGTSPNGPERLRLIEASIRPLLAAGFGEVDAMQISLLLSNYVIGLVLEDELSPLRAERGSEERDREMQAAGAAWRDALLSGQYPNLARSAAAIHDLSVLATEQRFAFGLDLLLGGLERRLPPDAPGRAGG